MQVKVLIVRGNGINAEAELSEAFRLAGARPQLVHINDLAAEPGLLDAHAILAFPGGFSYGDHLGSGQVLALLARKRLKPSISAFLARGGLVLGVCNGFQALVKMGVLPNRAEAAGGESWKREVSLIHNASGAFLDTWVPLEFEAASRCLWTAGLPPRSLPIRHGEGRFVTADEGVLAGLEAEGLVALRYGQNPNGSMADIAGICDPSGRVLGLMPHPEAFLVPENSPGRRRGLPGPLGLDLFERGVAAARDAS